MEDTVIIQPGKVEGRVRVPASKSLCHRAILAAGLADGTSRIDNVFFSADIEATIQVVQKLGAVVRQESNTLYIEGMGKKNAGKTADEKLQEIDCNESGSTLRFVVPILSALGVPARYTGRGKLGERPMQVYYDLFEEQNVAYETAGGCLPLTVQGRLKPGQLKIDGGISSQFITGLLMALPLLSEESEIQIIGTLQSKPYIDLTRSVLREFGIIIEETVQTDHTEKRYIYRVQGGQHYKAAHYRVEGDASQAAFLICAATIAGNEEGLLIEDLSAQTAQGDLAFLQAVAALGGQFEWQAEGLRVYPAQLAGNLTFDAAQCPDIVPILAVLGCYNKGSLQITGAERLRIKESDRLVAISSELGKLGAQVREEKDGLRIIGTPMHGGRVTGWNDHRIAMSMAVAALGVQGAVTIDEARSVKKSWPTFWSDFETIKR